METHTNIPFSLKYMLLQEPFLASVALCVALLVETSTLIQDEISEELLDGLS